MGFFSGPKLLPLAHSKPVHKLLDMDDMFRPVSAPHTYGVLPVCNG
jgi:hypothetical protein